jgi:hypothetical protein
LGIDPVAPVADLSPAEVWRRRAAAKAAEDARTREEEIRLEEEKLAAMSPFQRLRYQAAKRAEVAQRERQAEAEREAARKEAAEKRRRQPPN